jgi:hypothetical protein
MSQLSPSLPLISPAAGMKSISLAGRDLRLDFFRGVALLLIFIDHVSGNRFAAITLQQMGFADAAEVFVFIAGMSGVYAYRKVILSKGFAEGCRAVFARVRTLYIAHVAMVAGVLVFALAAHFYGTGFDIIRKLGLQPLLDDPLAGMVRLPVLAYLPHYLDILPLYVVLLTFLPLIILGQRMHVLLPVAAATAIYGVAQTFGWTLPNLGNPDGWFLNPFTWILLFVAGATTAQLTSDGVWARLPRALIASVTLAAAAYVVFAFLHAAPWRVIPALESFAAFSFSFDTDKAALSWHRLVDLLAKVWLVAVMIPRDASFMMRGVGSAISRAGRHSLPVFIAGTFLALLGSVVLYEGEGAGFWHVAVTAAGIMALLVQAWAIENRLGDRMQSAHRAFGPMGTRARHTAKINT